MSQNWPLAKFGEFLRPNSRPHTLHPEEDAHLVGMRLYGQGPFHREFKPAMQIAKKTHFVIKAGDVIYNKLFAWKGAFGIVPNALDGMFVSDKFPTFEIDRTKVDEGFLRWYFRCPPLWEQAQKMSTGSAALSKLTLNPPKFPLLTIPIPPLPEQHRVVARIEELAARIGEAQALRQQATEETGALNGALATKIFSAIPERHPIETVAGVYGGIQKGPHRAPGANPVRYLTVAHVQRDHILTDDPRYFEVTPEELERWRLVSGDVLIIEGNGSAEQIGRTALFRGEIANCVHQNHVIRIRPNTSRLLPEFLNWFLNSPPGQEAVQAQSRTTSGLRTLSVGRIRSIRVPVPTLSEQRRIVAELEELKTEVDLLESLQAETATHLDTLLPAILDRAFKGELA
jgi:type I restriction enzyme S subunit